MGFSCSLYVHIPFCISKCSYCDFFSVPFAGLCRAMPLAESDVRRAYVAALAEEAAFRAEELGIDSWKTIYIGGGTPSILAPEDVSALMADIRSARPAIPGAEITIEANPEDICGDWLDAAFDSGVTRLSVGIQSLRDEPLKACSRRSSRDSALRALGTIAASRKGRDVRLSCDLIAGLPSQDEQSLVDDVGELVSFAPDHISLYTLTIEEGTPLAVSLSEREAARLTERADDIWFAGRDALEKAGFRQYEVSNFARSPETVCRHNLAYWDMEPYLGIGPGSVGSFPARVLPGALRGPYGTASVRFSDVPDIPRWLSGPTSCSETEYISEKTNLFEYLMMGFRKTSGIGRGEFLRRFGFPLDEVIEPAYSRWKAKDFAHDVPSQEGSSDSAAALTREGLLFLNRFLEELPALTR